MPITEKTRHHRLEAKRARRRRRPNRNTPDSYLGASAQAGVAKLEEFIKPVTVPVLAAVKQQGVEAQERRDRRALDGHPQRMPAPSVKGRHGGGKQSSAAREQRRGYLRIYRRQLWPRRSELVETRSEAQMPMWGEMRDVLIIRRERWPVPRRRLVPLSLVKEVAEANIGVRAMERQAEEHAAALFPGGWRGRLARIMRRKPLAPGAGTPETVAAVERLYGTAQSEILAQKLGERAVHRREPRGGGVRRFFGRRGQR